MRKLLPLIFVMAIVFIGCAQSVQPEVVFSTPTIAVATETQIPATPTITPSPTATPKADLYYIVQPGDTLGSIAEKYGLEASYLSGINKIVDMDMIYVGQMIMLTGELLIPEATIDGKQIIVQLSTQKVFVYEDRVLLKTFVVSTGVTEYPTRIGEFYIYVKYELTRMTGPGYDLPNVPWVMYFDQGRSFHGTYWHSNFGYPMSHGCVNMRTDEAKWLYDWAEVGTEVLVIP